jgi:hypothetical protein
VSKDIKTLFLEEK